MKLLKLLIVLMCNILCMLPKNLMAQASAGINLAGCRNYPANIIAGKASGIIFGTSSKGSSGGVSGYATPDNKKQRHPRDCMPGAGICKPGALTRLSVSNNQIPTQPVLFIIDSVNNANLAMLIHLDSPSCSNIASTLRSYRHALDMTGGPGILVDFFPSIVSAFECPSTMAFTIDSASCSKMGLATDGNGLYIPTNTLCLIDTFASDTNFYKITFAGSISNKLSYTLGNPNSKCDASSLGICGFSTWGTNSNYGFYTTQAAPGDTGTIFNFFMNYDNIINAQPDMKAVFDNLDGNWPGTITMFPIQNSLGSYCCFPTWSGTTINSTNTQRGYGTGLSANWMVYQFIANAVSDDGSEGFIKRAGTKPANTKTKKK